MNKTQKLILAIFVPVILFFIAVSIANEVGVTKVGRSYKATPPFLILILTTLLTGGKLGMCGFFIQLPAVFLNFYYLGIKKQLPKEIKKIKYYLYLEECYKG